MAEIMKALSRITSKLTYVQEDKSNPQVEDHSEANCE